MIATCKTKLTAALVAAGLDAGCIYESLSDGQAHQQPPSVVLVAGDEDWQPDGTLVGREVDTDNETITHRVRDFCVKFTVKVLVSHTSQADGHALLVDMFRELGGQFEDSDGNPIRVERVKARWKETPSQLTEAEAVDAGVMFSGGTYTDKSVAFVGTASTTIGLEE